MKVRDYERSEVGEQRRRTASGRLLHCCCICQRLDVWSGGWSTFCSIKDLDDGAPIPKFCSEKCRAKGGPEAQDVTLEMRTIAAAAEWRPPTIAYREATEAEKYRAASTAQRGRAHNAHSGGTE